MTWDELLERFVHTDFNLTLKQVKGRAEEYPVPDGIAIEVSFKGKVILETAVFNKNSLSDCAESFLELWRDKFYILD